MHPRGLNAYRQTEVQSRTPVELVVMLYDGALRHVLAARTAIERNDIRTRREAINRVLAIVSELHSTLDVERGGAIAESLDELYAYVTRRVMDAATKNDVAPLDEVERLIATIREGWQQAAAAQANAVANPPGVAAPPTQGMR